MSRSSALSNFETTVASIDQVAKHRRDAAENGLVIQKVSWEDTSRYKGSSYGMNITDATLVTKSKTCMPVIRRPNFADVTADMPSSMFSVTVGNEKLGNTMKRISLEDYLTNASQYMSSNGDALPNKNIKNSLFDKVRDKNILFSAQQCILPLADDKCQFAVQLYNYQTSEENPAVLVVVSSQNGTSAQILDNHSTPLYFNKYGGASYFEASRLEDDRISKGKSTSGPMDSDEKERNVLAIYQIPLVVKKKAVVEDQYSFCNESYEAKESCRGSNSKGASRGIDHAVLSVAKSHGTFRGTGNVKLVRDNRFPIRCTWQYYSVTDTIELPVEFIGDIKTKFDKVYTKGVATGSLVVDGKTSRSTESDLKLSDAERARAPLSSFMD